MYCVYRHITVDVTSFASVTTSVLFVVNNVTLYNMYRFTLQAPEIQNMTFFYASAHYL